MGDHYPSKKGDTGRRRPWHLVARYYLIPVKFWYEFSAT
jgi:hypothetical protein